MPAVLAFSLTTVAMIAFAGNSLLCRLALKSTPIDPASFTLVRIASGALTLWLIVRLRGGTSRVGGNWPSALALLGYAACFSYAYVGLPAATGALLLFAAVQATMLGAGLWSGERLTARQSAGFACALAGLVGLLLPGLTAPPLAAAITMIAAGVAWGVYSLRGRGAQDPLGVTAGNFLRAAPVAALLSLATLPAAVLDGAGVGYAVASGALASGVGYAIWYWALRALKATVAASVQLSVPVIAAAGGAVFLDEAVTPRLLVASVAILGGIALVVVGRRRQPPARGRATGSASPGATG